jgi:hypothetical protein
VLRLLALALGLATAGYLALGDDPGPRDAALRSEAVRLAPLPAESEGNGAHAFAAQRRDGTARPVLFDPCRPVPWAVRRDGEPVGGDALLAGAVEEVARASGLRFVRVPDASGPLPQDDDLARRAADGSFAPVLVAWSSEREQPALEGGTLALGGGTTWAPEGRPGEERLVTGLVVLDAPDLAVLRAGVDGEARLRGALLHELAHLVGLGHVDDATQLLHAQTTGTAFAAGDLRGLRAAGQGQCFLDW